MQRDDADRRDRTLTSRNFDSSVKVHGEISEVEASPIGDGNEVPEHVTELFQDAV
ncbi:MAG: hypothetical protein AAFR47_19340 [Pseudomonadota bacterium]